MAKIFISYKRVDKEQVIPFVERIQNDLQESCWMDLDDIESDAQFASVIMHAIDEAKVFLFMYSTAHTTIENFDTDWTIRELNYAQQKKKRIVFVNLDNTPLGDWFVFMFPLKQQVNAKSKIETEKLLRNIAQWLQLTKYPPTKKSDSTRAFLGDTTQQFVSSSINYDDKETRLNYSVLGIPFTMIKTAERTYFGETPITQLLWETVMGNNPSRFKGEHNPVDSVSWNDCQLFINRLNNMTKMHFRLPTESEWEFAANGGKSTHKYKYSGSDVLDEVAWNLNNSDNRTHPVKLKMANELGLFDMSGNVWEWCNDKVEDGTDAGQTREKHTPRIFHVIKGGCWCETEKCTPAAREIHPPTFKSYGGLGLRLAMSL